MDDTTPVIEAEPCSQPEAPKGQYRRDGGLRGSAEPLPGACGTHLRGSQPPRYCAVKTGLDPVTRRCRFHKGFSGPAPIGRRSKHVPAALKAFYDDATSPEVKTIDDEIRRLDATITRLSDSLITGEGKTAWESLRDSVDSAKRADKETIDISTLSAIMDAHEAAEATEDRIAKLSLAKAKLVDTRTRQLAQAQSHVTPAELGQLVILFRETLQYVLTARLDAAVARELLAEFQGRIRAHPLLQ